MKDVIVRTVFLAIGVIEILCGAFFLRPWFEGVATYVHPFEAFYGAVFFIAFGGFFVALGSVGFRGFASTKCGIRLLSKTADENKTTQQAGVPGRRSATLRGNP